MPGALNWRLWLAVGFLVLLPILYVKGRTDGRKLERASVVAAQAQADNEARKIEQRRQDRVGEAAGLAAARAARLAADADRARDAADSLRSTLDAVERAAKGSGDAARESVAALRAVSESCAAEYRAMGREAAGHASDSLMLQQAWPK